MIAPGTFLAIYFVVWWICLFVVLPFGVRNQVDAGQVVPGSEAGAPLHPMFWRRVIWTTFLSIPVTAILLWLLTAKWLQEYWS